MHHISADAATKTIEVTLAGTLSVVEVDDYMADLRSAMLGARLAGDYGIVVDVTGCTIQTQEMIAAMGRRMTGMPKARAIAVVATSQLARLQIRRLFTQDHARVVSTMKEARGWARSGIEPDVTASSGRVPGICA